MIDRMDEISATRQPSTAELEGRVVARAVEISGVLITAGDGENVRVQDIGWITRAGSRISDIRVASLSAMPSCRAASARTDTPPADDSRPPSKAANTFLQLTDGNRKGRVVSSIMAGVPG